MGGKSGEIVGFEFLEDYYFKNKALIDKKIKKHLVRSLIRFGKSTLIICLI